MKSILIALALCAGTTGVFAQEIGTAKKPSKDVVLSEKKDIYDLLEISSDVELVGYTIVLTNYDEDKAYYWRMGTFPEENLMDMIHENKSGNCSISMEKVTYKERGSDKLKEMAPKKIRLK